MASSNQSKAFSNFGYPLHMDEHRGPNVDFSGVRQIPDEARKRIDLGGEDWLSPDLYEQMDKSIDEAKRELFARHLAALRAQSGGNQYDADGRYIGGQDEHED